MRLSQCEGCGIVSTQPIGPVLVVLDARSIEDAREMTGIGWKLEESLADNRSQWSQSALSTDSWRITRDPTESIFLISLANDPKDSMRRKTPERV